MAEVAIQIAWLALLIALFARFLVLAVGALFHPYP